jgi:hypothetical protein
VTGGEIAVAAGWFVVFACTAVLMGRSALRDTRAARRDPDAVAVLSAAEQWWPTVVAAVVACAIPIALVANA